MSPGARYPQFCALARAAELIGERWTLLVVRELLLGPKRFTDLAERLAGISPSVLAGRLARMEKAGLVRRSRWPPPAAASVYELTGDGHALRPAVWELIRWGGRFLFPARRGEQFEPEWTPLALEALARHGPVPARSFRLRIRQGRKAAVLRVMGGPSGTSVDRGDGACDATLTTTVETLLAIVSGALAPDDAVRRGLVETSGDAEALREFPLLFEVRPAASEVAAGQGA